MEIIYIISLFYITIIISLLFIFGITLSHKKETLEIFVKDDNISFLLNGDEYLKIKKSYSIDKTITDTVVRYKKELSSIVGKISFIKYDNPKIKDELYEILNLK